METPATRSLTIEGTLKGCVGKLNITVEPSSLINHGVFIRTNEHHEQDSAASATPLMKTLADRWGSAQASAKQLAEKLLEQCQEEKP